VSPAGPHFSPLPKEVSRVGTRQKSVTNATMERNRTGKSGTDGSWRPSLVPSQEAISDETLVRRCLEGEREAFEMLFERYRQPVFALTLRYSGDSDEADDLLQDVFLKVFERLHLFKFRSAFSTWLYRIAVNTSLDRRRWRKRREEPPPDWEPTPGTTAPDIQLDQERLREVLDEALQELPEHFRLVVILKDMQDFPYEDIASILGISRGTVASRLNRGRRALRKVLERKGFTLEGVTA
jgi:RNA polymerase sigma-70 factor (ECF subfamily)